MNQKNMKYLVAKLSLFCKCSFAKNKSSKFSINDFQYHLKRITYIDIFLSNKCYCDLCKLYWFSSKPFPIQTYCNICSGLLTRYNIYYFSMFIRNRIFNIVVSSKEFTGVFPRNKDCGILSNQFWFYFVTQ